MCICVGVYVHEYRYPQSLEQGTGSPGAGDTNDCELLNVGAGNPT